ncbi:MAG: transposase family protein, partial [Candidatus Brocadiaceae bacterium]|nr:transposase family protein [Candidatus Brocadiaceae bacterium]
FVGVPKTCQHDQGTNFMSKIFQQVLYEMGIQDDHSTAYHPESQGALERFHQTLKLLHTNIPYKQLHRL